MQLYFNWANDPVVRKNAFNSNTISWRGHQEWYRHRLHDKNCYMYVIENDGIEIGQVRFDIVNSNAEISYSVDDKFRGKGIGKELLILAINELKNECSDISEINAKVKKQNIASNKIFMKLGFDAEEKNDIYFYRLTI